MPNKPILENTNILNFYTRSDTTGNYVGEERPWGKKGLGGRKALGEERPWGKKGHGGRKAMGEEGHGGRMALGEEKPILSW
jgi:hypothetical protein